MHVCDCVWVYVYSVLHDMCLCIQYIYYIKLIFHSDLTTLGLNLNSPE